MREFGYACSDAFVEVEIMPMTGEGVDTRRVFMKSMN